MQEHTTLVDILGAHAERRGDAPAYILLDGSAAECARTSFGELHRRATEIASDPKRIAARADILSQRLGYNRKRILGWAAAHAALSACWDLEAGNAITGQLACLPNLLSAYDLA